MFEKLKTVIPKLAKDAVLKVEKELDGENGQVKKTAAIEFVVKNLPVQASLKNILGYFLSIFIDSAIEIAVAFMKQYREEEPIEG